MQTLNYTKFVQDYNLKNDVGNLLNWLPRPISGKRWLAGGAIRRLFQNKEIDSDLDYFFKSKEDFDAFCAEIEELTTAPRDILTLGVPKVTLISKKENQFNTAWELCIQDYELKEDKTISRTIKVQAIIIDFYDSPQELLESFDFTICCFALDQDNIYCHDTAIWDLLHKRLVVNKITYAVASFRRILKYSKEFYMCSGSIQKFLQETTDNTDDWTKAPRYID